MKKVRIRKATARDFGRLKTGTVDLTGNDFVVVYGPNEAGKSTLADMLSWVLAGRRLGTESGLRFAGFRNRPGTVTTVTIGGQIEGTLDDQDFTVSRDFIIRTATKGREPVPNPPTIFLDGGQIPESEWASRIGVTDGEQYYRQYRITGPYDPDNHVDIMKLLEALTVGTSVATPPRKIMARLGAAADTLVHSSSGRNSGERHFRKATDRLNAANERIKTIHADSARAASMEQDIIRAGADQERVDRELLDLKDEKGALETARELLDARTEGEAAAEELSRLPELDPERLRAHAVAAGIANAVERVDRALQDAKTKQDALDAEIRSAGITNDQAAGIAVADGTVDRVNELVSSRADMAGQASRAEEKTVEKTKQLGSLNEQLAALASELRTTTDHLLRLGAMSLDDQSFGDPVREWVDAVRGLPGLRGAFDSDSATERRAQDEFDGIDRQWAKENIATAPQIVAEGRTVPPSAPRSSMAKGMAAVVVMTATAAQLHRAAGIAAAVLGLGAVWLVSRRSAAPLSGLAPQQESKEIISLAQDWVRTKDALDRARTSRDSSESALSRHTGRMTGLEETAHRVLAQHGFDPAVHAEIASTIRSQRTLIADLARQERQSRQDISGAEDARVRSQETVQRMNNELAAIAAEIGLGHLGDRLTGEKVQQARDIQRKTAELGIALAEARSARQSLEELAGPWSVGMSTGEITVEMSVVAGQVKKRSEVEATWSDSEKTIRTRAPQGSRAATILADPGMTPDVIRVRISHLEETIGTKEEERDAALIRTGGLKKTLDDLAGESDLPLVQQELDQANADLHDIAVRGAALLLAEKIVADVKDEVERANQPAVIRRASEIAVRITDGAWSGLVVAEDEQIVVAQNGTWMDQLSLSAGARDVLRLCIRIAFAEHHAEKTGLALPLILDDPTASVDGTRAPRLFDVLADFSLRHQVIVMTHDPGTVARAEQAGATRVDVSALA